MIDIQQLYFEHQPYARIIVGSAEDAKVRSHPFPGYWSQRLWNPCPRAAVFQDKQARLPHSEKPQLTHVMSHLFCPLSSFSTGGLLTSQTYLSLLVWTHTIFFLFNFQLLKNKHVREQRVFQKLFLRSPFWERVSSSSLLSPDWRNIGTDTWRRGHTLKNINLGFDNTLVKPQSYHL